MSACIGRWRWTALAGVRAVVAGVVVAALALWPACAPAADPEAPKDPIARQAELALWWGDIGALEALYAEAARSTVVNPWNDRTATQSVRAGISAVLKYAGLDGAYFRELELLATQWVAQKPDAGLRRLLLARVLHARAWHVRGSGYWRTVPEPARAEFVRLNARAEQVIAERAPTLMADPTTHMYLLMIGRAAGWRADQALAIVDDGLSRSPSDALPLLEELVVSLLPRWGGDLAQAQRVIDKYSAQVDTERTDEVYAQLWYAVAWGTEGNVFREIRPDWPRIRAGYSRLANRVGDPAYRNRLAHLACLAQDLDTARAALKEIPAPDLGAWVAGGGGGQQNYEACVAWAAGVR